MKTQTIHGTGVLTPRRSKVFEAVGNAVCALLFGAAVFALGWLYLMATPDQMSGEYDWTAQEMAQAEGGAR